MLYIQVGTSKFVCKTLISDEKRPSQEAMKVQSTTRTVNKLKHVLKLCMLFIFKPGMHRAVCRKDSLCVCVFMCVCVPPRLLTTSGVMWCDIDPI